MKGVVITTNNDVRIQEFTTPLYQSARYVLDGYIENVHPRGLERPYCMMVNDEGLLRDLPLNLVGSILYGTQEHGSPILGNIIIMKEGWTPEGRDFVGLDDDEAERIKAAAENLLAELRSSVIL